jgi:hypothetical protein
LTFASANVADVNGAMTEAESVGNRTAQVAKTLSSASTAADGNLEGGSSVVDNRSLESHPIATPRRERWFPRDRPWVSGAAYRASNNGAGA